MDDDIRVVDLNIESLCKLDPLTKDQEIKLFRRLARVKLDKNKQQIRNEIILRNGRLIVSVVSRYYYSNCNVAFHELVQEGVFGLSTAIRKFNYKRGYKFSTYATPWIRQAVTRYMAEHSRNVRLPVYKSDLYNKIGKMREDEPHISDEELTEKLGIKDIQDVLIHGPGTLSLDAIVQGEPDEFDNTGYDINASDSVTDFDDTREHIAKHIEAICNAREARILQMRFGLVDGDEMTLKEIGAAFGLTRERIRQIEANALRKLSTRIELRELL